MALPKKILIINYYWPPCGGPAVQRWLDFANRLVEDRVEVHVITIDEAYATYTAIDHSLTSRVDSRIHVHKTESREWYDFYKKYIGKGKIPGNALADEPNPNFLQKIARFVRGNFLLPDPRRGWNKFAYAKAIEIIDLHKIDTYVTAGPPHSTHLVGREIKKAYGNRLKWIADFHDYWTDVFYLRKFYRTKIARYFDLKMEMDVLRSANIVLTHCEVGSKLYKSKLPNNQQGKIHIIRMGYDESWFENYTPNTKQDVLRIVYTGTLPDYYHSDSLFMVISKAKDQVKDLPLEIHLIGTISKKVEDCIVQNGLRGITFFPGYIPFLESVAHIKKASILLLINPDVPGDQGIVPGKIYEYLATKNNIVSLSSHDGENEYLLNQLNAGKNFERHELGEMTAYFEELFEKWKINGNILYNNSNTETPYSRRSEYDQLKILLFNGI